MTALDFDSLIQPLGPFERPPVLAAAVSGGSDSTALGLMLADWVAARGGRLQVLSVDHGLRPAARAEAETVIRRFAALPGCTAEILEWRGAKPASGLQEAARDARYGLLTAWCRDRGVLHLAIGHTADDQAETLAMRRAHRSTGFGLAAMPALAQRDGVRVLRPLLALRRAELRAWLSARGESWSEDPSNLAQHFERVRQRAALELSGDAAALAAEASGHGRARDAGDRAVARWLADAATLSPAGFATLDMARWREADPALRRAILRRVLLAVGGHDYPPRPVALDAAVAASLDRTRVTLGGCILGTRGGRLVACREAGDIRDRHAVSPGWSGSWDRRFTLQVAFDLPPEVGGIRLSVGPLGEAGQRQAVRTFDLGLKRHPVPEAARAALPALWRGEEMLAQPHLGLGQGLAARSNPRHCVTTCGFTVALDPPHTIYSSIPG